ncbi:MAG: penicillin-binding protein activator, partial [Pseudomonadota bacterium]
PAPSIRRQESVDVGDKASDQSRRGLVPGINQDQRSALHRLAMFVPLSGPLAEKGRGLRDAAMLAIFGSALGNVELAFYDSFADLPVGSLEYREHLHSLTRLAIDEGAAVIIGPLLGDATHPVSQIAGPRGIPVISFSNNTDLAVMAKEGQGGTFIFGMAPEQQIASMLGFIAKGGAARIALLAPDTEYGRLVRRALHQLGPIQVADLSIIDVLYDPAIRDFSKPTDRLIAKARRIDFLLLAVNDQVALRIIAAQLDQRDIGAPSVQLIGLQPWQWLDDLGSEPALNSAWFVGIPEAHMRLFGQHFQAIFGNRPEPFSAIAYDAVMIVAALLNREGSTVEKLSARQGFLTINGLVRFDHTGLSERTYAIYRVHDDSYSLLDPAAGSFAGKVTDPQGYDVVDAPN